MPAPSITRPDGSEVSAQVIKLGKTEHTTRRVYEPVIDGAGHIIAAEVNTDLDKAGIRLVIVSEDELQLTKHAKSKGCVFYRDMCYGRIEGVEASPKHWAIYEMLAEMKAANRVPKGDYPNSKIYHPEVMRRRAADDQGVGKVGHPEMDKIIAELSGSDTDEDRAAAKKAGLKIPAEKRKSSATLDELLDQANG